MIYILLLLPLFASGYGIYLLYNYPYLSSNINNIITGVILAISVIILLLGAIFKRNKMKKSLIATICFSLLATGGIGYCDYIYYQLDKQVENMNDTKEYQYSYVYVLDTYEGSNLESLDGKTIGFQSETSELCYQVPHQTFDEMNIEVKEEIYANPTTQSSDLLNGKVDAIIVSSADLTKIDSVYTEFALKTKCIGEFKIELSSDDMTNSVDIKTQPFTVLINGVDTRSGNLNESSHADVIMIATFNPQTLKLSLISIPRDTYIPVTCEGGIRDKITHSGNYGIQCTIDSLEQYFNIDINYYVKLNFDAVVKLVNAIGGIDVNVPRSFCEQNSKSIMNAICLDEGFQHLDGEQALAFARHRKTLPNGDIGRGMNQQIVINGMIDKLASGKIITSVDKLLGILGENVQTNINKKDMMSLFSLLTSIGSQSLYSNTSSLQITQSTIAGEGRMLYADWAGANIWYYIPYKESVASIKTEIAKVLGNASFDAPTSFTFDANVPFNQYDPNSTQIMQGQTLDVVTNGVADGSHSPQQVVVQPEPPTTTPSPEQTTPTETPVIEESTTTPETSETPTTQSQETTTE